MHFLKICRAGVLWLAAAHLGDLFGASAIAGPIVTYDFTATVQGVNGMALEELGTVFLTLDSLTLRESTAAPEPGSLALLAGGLACLVAAHRRRR
jgi:hypothetical protein